MRTALLLSVACLIGGLSIGGVPAAAGDQVTDIELEVLVNGEAVQPGETVEIDAGEPVELRYRITITGELERSPMIRPYDYSESADSISVSPLEDDPEDLGRWQTIERADTEEMRWRPGLLTDADRHYWACSTPCPLEPGDTVETKLALIAPEDPGTHQVTAESGDAKLVFNLRVGSEGSGIPWIWFIPIPLLVLLPYLWRRHNDSESGNLLTKGPWSKGARDTTSPCPECESTISQSDTFCPDCGVRLTDDDSANQLNRE